MWEVLRAIALKHFYKQREPVSGPCPVSIDECTTPPQLLGMLAYMHRIISLGIRRYPLVINNHAVANYSNAGVCCAPDDLRHHRCAQLVIYQEILLATTVFLHLAVTES